MERKMMSCHNMAILVHSLGVTGSTTSQQSTGPHPYEAPTRPLTPRGGLIGSLGWGTDKEKNTRYAWPLRGLHLLRPSSSDSAENVSAIISASFLP